MRKAKNGPPIPDTSGQKWHYIENVSYGMTGGGNLLRGNLLGGRRAVLDGGIMSFEETFEQDNVFVSMRFPYTYGYNEAFLTKLAKNYPWVKVHNVGKSKEGRNLRIVQIGEGDKRPTVVIYAREHGNEHDTSHLAEGAVRFLVSDDENAVRARAKFCFILIPLVDPDGATAGKYDNITNNFFFGKKDPEILAYSAWFKKWMDDGNRLDVIFNVHNVRSQGASHLFSPMMESGRLADCQALHQVVMNEMKNFQVEPRPRETGYSLFRLGGWLQDFYSPLYIAYELNSQTPSRHLAIAELREMGECITRASAKYLDSPQAQKLLEGNANAQAARKERWAKLGQLFADKDALVAEEKCRKKAQEEGKSRK